MNVASAGVDPPWWRTWRTARVTPVPGLVVEPTDDGVLAVAPGFRVRILETWQAALIPNADRSVPFADFDDEVTVAGIPRGEDPRAVMVQACLAMAGAGLVIVDEQPETVVPRVTGPEIRDRRGREVRGLADTTAPPEPLEVSSTTDDPGGRTVVRSGVWIRKGPDGVTAMLESGGMRIPADATWTDEVVLGHDTAGVTVESGTIGFNAGPEPLVRFELIDDASSPVERMARLCDLLEPRSARSNLRNLTMAIDLEQRGLLVAVPPELPVANRRDGTEVTARFERLGDVQPWWGSTKLSTGVLHLDRRAWTWTYRARSGTDHGDAMALLAEFGVPAPAADAILALPGHNGQFVVGIEPGSGRGPARHKVYVEIAEERTFDALVELEPIFGQLHDASVISPGLVAEHPPRYVAWKSSGSVPAVRSVYRLDHAPGVTVAAALDAMDLGEEWTTRVAELVERDRPLHDLLGDQDFEAIDEDGRRSIDLYLQHASPRGGRFAPAERLAQLAGIDPVEGHAWAEQIARSHLLRMIVGKNRDAVPFLGTYGF